NDDGKDDLIVAVPTATFSGRANAGTIYVKFGTSTPSASYDVVTNADLVIGGPAASAKAGALLACGQYASTPVNSVVICTVTQGIYVVYGGAGVYGTATRDLNNAGHYNVKISTGSTYSMLAFGDLNGDGYGDIVTCFVNSACKGFLGAASPSTSA